MKGFGRIAVATPDLHLGDPASNAVAHRELAKAAADAGVSILAFPELSLTGYTCGDLFFRDDFLEAAWRALRTLASETADLPLALAVGVPLKCGAGVFNTAVVLSGGQIRGAVPKTYLPTYGEYYEHRQFTSATALPVSFTLGTGPVPFATNLVFSFKNIRFSVELCEDLWVPIPPSSRLAGAGLDCVFNLSASTEFLGKGAQRQLRVVSQSAVLRCVYALASAGVGESSSDAVFGGQALIAADGKLLKVGNLFSRRPEIVSTEIDFEALAYRRRSETSLNETTLAGLGSVPARFVPCEAGDLGLEEGCHRSGRAPDTESVGTGPEGGWVDAHPFLTEFGEDGWVEKMLAIQSVALERRMKAARSKRLVIGVSGGADSALALLAAARAVARANQNFKEKALSTNQHESARIGESPSALQTADLGTTADFGTVEKGVLAVVMPAFASSEATQSRAIRLAQAVGAEVRVIDIRAACRQHLHDIGHDEATHDLAYENVQARERTQILMDIANMEGGLVVGTGDLSEIALGWNTYNGDHMSMYQVNASVPKTMVLAALREVAAHSPAPLGPLLREIAEAPITPELVPDAQANDSEARLGPYELHDFFLYHFLANGASREKLDALAQTAFRGVYDAATIRRTRDTFWRRFFAAQYKRNCVPDGPKITLSLSPRADWRMPSDAEAR